MDYKTKINSNALLHYLIEYANMHYHRHHKKRTYTNKRVTFLSVSRRLFLILSADRLVSLNMTACCSTINNIVAEFTMTYDHPGEISRNRSAGSSRNPGP